MMRIFRAYHMQVSGQSAVGLTMTPGERKRRCLRAGGWSLWIIMMLVCGYYGHVLWRQYFPEVADSSVNKAMRPYWLSDVHYVFKKSPLPARIEIDNEVTPEEGYTPDSELTAAEEDVPEGDAEESASETDALRLRVQQALKEVDGKQP